MDGGGAEPPEGVTLGLEPAGPRDGQHHFDQLRIELGSGVFFDLAKSLLKAPALSIRPVGSQFGGEDPFQRASNFVRRPASPSRAGHEIPPSDQGGGSPLEPSTSGSPWPATGSRSSWRRSCPRWKRSNIPRYLILDFHNYRAKMEL